MTLNRYHARDEVISGSISAIAAFLVLLSYCLLPQIRRLRFIELATYVALNDFIASIGIALGGNPTGSIACWIQGMTTNAPFVSSAMWNVVIAFQIWLIVNRGSAIENMKWFHIFCWGLPWLFTLLPLTTNTYGEVDDRSSWCFIADRNGSPSWGILTWELLSFYAWLWLSIFAIILFVSLIAWRISRSWEVTSDEIKRMVFKITMYPSVLIICWALDTFVDLYVFFAPEDGRTWVALIRFGNFLSGLQGFLLSVVYFSINSEVYQLLRLSLLQNKYFAYFCFCLNNEKQRIEPNEINKRYAKLNTQIQSCRDYQGPVNRDVDIRSALFNDLENRPTESRFTNLSAISNPLDFNPSLYSQSTLERFEDDRL